MITKLKKNEIFVFGSNANGAHAGGAALQAFQKFGARIGIEEGLTGRSYAFPTLDKNMKKVSITAFKKSVTKLYTTANEYPDKKFLLTKVGCGIAGFDESEVKALFVNAPENVILPEDWKEKEARVLYKFLREGLKSQHGNATWKVGEWKKESSVSICNSGFHASNTPREAFSYVQGEVLAIVEARGENVEQEDKSCWEEMRAIKAYKWQKKDSVALSIFAAELCIKNYEAKYPNDSRPRDAIEAAKKWLAEPTEENQSAAARSARSAGSAASASAAAAAAWSAWSAAASAWSASESSESSESSVPWSARSASAAARSASAAAWSSESSESSVTWSARSVSAWSAAASAWSAAAWSAAAAAKKTLLTSIDHWSLERIKTLEEV
jgi:hypothetical protein